MYNLYYEEELDRGYKFYYEKNIERQVPVHDIRNITLFYMADV